MTDIDELPGAGRKAICSDQTGASMVELALVLPLVLLGVVFFIWLGTLMHAKSSLDAAVVRSLRLACTRGVKEVAGLELIGRIQNWQRGASSSTVAELLTSGDVSNWEAWYDDRVKQLFPDYQELRELDSEYIYALVYVNEAMKQSIGAGIRYPCNPEDISSGAGCLGCSFLNPDNLDSAFPSESPAQFLGTVPRRKLGIECRFQPEHSLLSPLVGLLRIVSGDLAKPLVILKKKAFVDVPTI